MRRSFFFDFVMVILCWTMFTAVHAQPVPPGGGEFIIMDEFNIESGEPRGIGDPWCGSGACDPRTQIEYSRADASEEWEHWPKEASGSAVYYDGTGQIQMEMNAAPWQSYIDARNGSRQALTADHSYAVMAFITMPASGGMGFGLSEPSGSYFRGIKMIGGNIYFANNDESAWGDTGGDLQAGTYTVGTEIGLMFLIDTSGNVTLWRKDGSEDRAVTSNWIEFTPASDPNGELNYSHETEVLSIHTLSAASDLEADTCAVDYLAWIEDPGMPGGPPVNAARNWVLFD